MTTLISLAIKAGLIIVNVENLKGELVKLIHARPLAKKSPNNGHN